jgi:hypothetical protein
MRIVHFVLDFARVPKYLIAGMSLGMLIITSC